MMSPGNIEQEEENNMSLLDQKDERDENEPVNMDQG
ncbi:hypothetical protein OESDEN_24836 [Oesophagostomum dentatum]|uniref:Uncharacterized protein n=1 Tax=Oesophagostomum dentatum TaxID=61180 RepID=A0A0B1RR43_OESDE|nr:hypothetical protein OESDEN_24836 [Oesophagostomum dentatum]